MLAIKIMRMTISRVSELLPIKVLMLNNILMLFFGEEVMTIVLLISIIQGHR